MLHTLYIFAFTIIAFLAISNLIRNLITLSTESNRRFSSNEALGNTNNSQSPKKGNRSQVTHPELLDENGQPINEPLLVMRSVTVEDARQRLDALYDSSPSKTKDIDGEA